MKTQMYDENVLEAVSNQAYDDGFEAGRERGHEEEQEGYEEGYAQAYKNVVNEDFGQMLISALRYALGRQTYITSETAKYINTYLKDLSNKVLIVMKRDLEYYENRRGDGLIYDDEECDHIHWSHLLNEIKKEMEVRGVSDIK